RGKQGVELRDFVARTYPVGSADLATAFVCRAVDYCAPGGTTALVSPQNWLTLSTYQGLRMELLNNLTWNVVVRLGAKAFQTQMWDFNVALLIASCKAPRNDARFSGIDAGDSRSASETGGALVSRALSRQSQNALATAMESRVV